MIFELVADYASALDAIPSEHPRRRTLSLLAEAVRCDVHFIHRHPTTLFQCLWNACWWFDCPEAAGHCEPPEAGSSGQVAGGQPGPVLSGLLESWRDEKESATAEHIWLRSSRPPPDSLGLALAAVFHGHTEDVTCLAFASAGDRLASGSRDGSVRLWDPANGWEVACLQKVYTQEEVDRLQPEELVGLVMGAVYRDVPGVAVEALAWSPDDRLIAATSHRSVRLWDAQSGEERACLRGHDGPVGAVAWSRRGRLLASGGNDKAVCVWDAETGERLALLRCLDMVTGVCFAGEGYEVLAGCFDGSVLLFDWQRCPTAPARLGGRGRVGCVAAAPGGGAAAWGLDDGSLVVWDVARRAERLTLKTSAAVRGLAFSADGGRLAASDDNGTVWMWDAHDGTAAGRLRRSEVHGGPVAFAPGGACLAGGSGETLVLWDLQRPVAAGNRPADHRVCLEELAFSQDGLRLVTAGRFQATLRVWDGLTGRPAGGLRIDGAEARHVCFSPDGRHVVAVSDAGAATVWETAGGAEILRLGEEGQKLVRPTFSPDGRLLACGSEGGVLLVWDWPAGTLRHLLEGHGGHVNGLHFSADGRTLASCAGDHTVRVWDLPAGRERHCLRGHSETVFGVPCVAVAPDGRLVASGGGDRAVIVWDARQGRPLGCLRGHGQEIAGLAFTPDGRRLLSAAYFEAEVRVWDLRDGACLMVLPGWTDLEELARCRHAWRLMVRGREAVVEPMAGGPPVAWFPAGLHGVCAHPSGRAWAGGTSNHLRLLTLEGVEP